jgi:hypothetical protein
MGSNDALIKLENAIDKTANWLVELIRLKQEIVNEQQQERKQKTEPPLIRIK